MNFLLFFVSSIFAFIFYVFHKLSFGAEGGEISTIYNYNISSLSGNLFIEAILFLFIGILFFFSFSNYSFFKKKDPKKAAIKTINKKKVFGNFNVRIFLKKNIYVIGFIFFYSSIFFILKSFGITDFSYLMFFLNVIIGALFFISSKAELFRDFIKINTILFSLYYIFFYVFSLVFGVYSVGILDNLNTLFIFSFFIITFYGDFKLLKSGKSQSIGTDSSLVLYFFLYSFIVSCFYLKQLFLGIGISFTAIFMYVGVFFNIVIYFFLQKISLFSNVKYILRALSFLFMYISMLFGIEALILFFDLPLYKHLSIFAILIYGIIFNYFVHNKFQNYISFSFSLLVALFLLYYFVFKYVLFSGGNLAKVELILSLTVSFFIVVITYIYKFKYMSDVYFLHYCSYLVNFLGTVYYFVYADFYILHFGVVLLLESIFLFLSYFKLKKINIR